MTGYAPGALNPNRDPHGSRFVPNMRHMYVELVARLLASDPAAPFCRFVMKADDPKPEPAAIPFVSLDAFGARIFEKQAP